MRRRIFLFSSIAAAGLAGCAAGPDSFSMAPNSTLIVVRHADRKDEDLTAAGRARARALVKALDGMKLDAIYSPGIKRNLDTAMPLSKARSLPITRRPQEAPTAPLVTEGAGKTVIWVGNKGNIAQIWEDLRLTDPAPLEYGDLFIVRSDATGAVTIERRRFGAS
ncbi:histidine phosphatase family protein [Thalassococcus lentus]|uniref:Histidine phosphatase family protein n=1 Tax=Thalassococcus lentus TaxID=1210524 RepID=A0ABT4XWC8_9RHOB|nr:histidine phosphatase family protein [Thalassococcus lentus]MDA7426192.1 histidine phosphatase family protein [Thalassococcus lentus]